MLQVEHLSVKYGPVMAVRDLSLRVDEGELIGVIGPNGAGKSTLLLAIAGAVPIAAGEIVLDGVSLRGRRPERIVRDGIALVPEGRHIFGSLTVEENLLLGATLTPRGPARATALRHVLEVFPVLERYLGAPAGRLSGGEQQQLAIARALLARPRLILLDEPSLGLAPLVVDRVFEVLNELRAEGVTILLVEQVALRTIQAANRTYVLRRGAVVLEGTQESLTTGSGIEDAYLGSALGGVRVG